MKDVRDCDIRVGDTVAFARLKRGISYSTHLVTYGTVFKMSEKMVFIKDAQDSDKHIQKAPHNVIVVRLP